MAKRTRLLTAIILAALPLAAAHAQDRDLDREPSVGKIFAGEVPDGGGAARFLLTLAAGQAIELTAAPVGGSDPFVRVYDAGSGDLIAENDDASGSLAASVRLFSPRAQRVRVEVTNGAVDSNGAGMRFDLVVRPSDFRPQPVQAITLGGSLEGTLARGDERLFRFEAERGQLWDISLAAAPGSALDPMLQVFAGELAGGTALGQDDDGGNGLNARLRFLVPADGTYTVRASGVGQTDGPFVFSAGLPEPSLPTGTLELGQTVTGTLASASAERLYQLSDAARAALAGGAGPLVIHLRRVGEADGGLDPLLEIGFDTPLGFTTLLTDDDSGGNGNARLAFDASDLTAPWLEAMRIKARAFQDTTGDYELVVGDGSGD